ncbi:hypothetical protein TH66_22860 [Carbonactinospora thermoautotrophica]|uniref:Uncharacterized protein n=1 Tax=Carbonactinospora thermoautotrophica TaxID=1469144 RepID=A0A132MJQ8_9ACTN|nr:hypothetical protein TH66_22860 [Carbonactinospora thermoautotrophica]KWX09257.1 hypothetical protein TR74_10685 [Carbonactinospora thermoautotrophica]
MDPGTGGGRSATIERAAAPLQDHAAAIPSLLWVGFTTWSVGRCGAMTVPSGSSSPVSSNTTTPLHNRLHPCSGWHATVRAASRSGASADGHGGMCRHIS